MVKTTKNANGEGSKPYKDKYGRWCVRHTFHTPDGRPKHKAFYGRTKAEALAKKNRALADYYNGVMVFDAENLTLGQHLERWLKDSKRSPVKDTTIESYSTVIRCHVVPALGRVKLKNLNPAHLQGLYRAKLDEGLSARRLLGFGLGSSYAQEEVR